MASTYVTRLAKSWVWRGIFNMAKEINGKFYLEKGDRVEATGVETLYDGKDGWEFKRLNDASKIEIWIDSEEEWYEIYYDFKLPKNNPNYGRPYYEM